MRKSGVEVGHHNARVCVDRRMHASEGKPSWFVSAQSHVIPNSNREENTPLFFLRESGLCGVDECVCVMRGCMYARPVDKSVASSVKSWRGSH